MENKTTLIFPSVLSLFLILEGGILLRSHYSALAFCFLISMMSQRFCLIFLDIAHQISKRMCCLLYYSEFLLF